MFLYMYLFWCIFMGYLIRLWVYMCLDVSIWSGVRASSVEYITNTYARIYIFMPYVYIYTYIRAFKSIHIYIHGEAAASLCVEVFN